MHMCRIVHIRIACAEMHTFASHCSHCMEMHAYVHIMDAKDMQIMYANVCMMLAPELWCQTPEIGSGVVAFTNSEAQVEIKKYIFICTHFATSSSMHILPGISSVCCWLIALSIQPERN